MEKYNIPQDTKFGCKKDIFVMMPNQAFPGQFPLGFLFGFI